jgi:hypothetical protein
MNFNEGWKANSNGNFVWLGFGRLRATVYVRDDGTWGGIWNDASDGRPRRLKGTFDTPEEAQSAIESGDLEGDESDCWCPADDEWQERKKGGFYRKVNGVTVSVKQAKSKSWYAVRMGGARLGENGYIKWFSTAEEACNAVDALTRGHGAYCWTMPH